MKNKMFGQNIKPDCAYCENTINDNNFTGCGKNKKIQNGKCRAFKYDPLMRIPKANPKKREYTADDFKL